MNDLLRKFQLYGFKKSSQYIANELHLKIVKQKMKKSFSQSEEDLHIDKLLGYKKKGFYVDVGAYDPNRFSNTKRFYLRGWRGINIEPDNLNYKKFLAVRKEDINLNIGVGEKSKKIIFYKFFPNTLSTFSKNSAAEYEKQGFRLLEKISIEVKPLARIFEKYCNKKKIDFVSIDTEGAEETVLKSNNWKKFRPTVICIETLSHDNKTRNKKLEDYLRKQGYKKDRDIGPNSIFISR